LDSDEVARIRIGALLHDVGKIGIPDAILSKEGPLTLEEWAIIRQHPVLGKTIVEQSPELSDVVPMVLHHQERWDGTGYPSGLSARAIPLGARIIAAADAYHAIRSDRPYRSGRSHAEAAAELKRCSTGQFDPRVVGALLESLDRDPALRSVSGRKSSPDEVRTAAVPVRAPRLTALSGGASAG
jgi:HD-GYP domain-containing protein (c-di-GMP phosphodiesterase class II)